jgi:tetratricopeptide (TPR) repeat protein
MFGALPRLISPFWGALLAWTLLVPVVRSGQEDPSWVGKRIILRRDGVRIGHTDDKGQPVYVADLTDMVYRVLGEADGWLRVRQRGAEGWFAKDSAVLLEDAIPYFTDRLRGNGRDALAYAHRGRAWQEKGALDRALQDYDDAIRIAAEADEPRFGALELRRLIGRRVTTYPPQASWFRNRAVVYDSKGEPDKAIREFTEAVRLGPTDPLTYVDRGITYKGLKDYDKALADHGEAIRLDPQWGTPYFHRANVFKARKDYDKALADYSAAIRLDPKDPDAYFNRANTYRATKQYARAADDWSQVIRLDAQDAEAHDRLGWLLATCPDGQVRDGQRAVDHAGTACDLTDGKSAYCLATLAAAFAETGRFDLAVKWQTRALESPQYEREEGPAARQRLQLFENRKPYREE